MNISDSEQATTELSVIPQVVDVLKITTNRIGKITQAILLIASIVPDKQSLLETFSGQAVQLLSQFQALEFAPEQATSTTVQKIQISLKHLMQLNELCHVAGLVSDMNYQILTTELSKVTTEVNQHIMTYCIPSVEFPFRIHQSITTNQSGTQLAISIEQYFTDPQSGVPTNELPKKTLYARPPETPQRSPEINQNTPKQGGNSLPQTTSARPTFPELTNTNQLGVIKTINGEDKKERRDAIMRTIRSKGKVTIKDISEHITGCSEKTIQRDLQELIHHGVLIREGEKRWAVYKLAMKNL
jgi:hypothetical protein